MADLEGQQLGHYRLLRVLGRGAFATVYLGEHQYLERLAAIKVLHVRMEAGAHGPFRHEARTIAQLDHQHIICVHDFGIEGEIPYLVMEYIQGGTLRSRHPKGSQLSFEQIITYVKQIASALDYAHQRHVVHRDIKPENILLKSKHEVVLSDFGLAVVQSTLDSLSIHNPAGTLQYMAPEQFQGQPCAASDQYALGVMVYEWLCGEPPFDGPFFEIFSQHLQKPPPSLRARLPLLPSAVEDVVFVALAKVPERRFDSVAKFATQLSEAFFGTQLVLDGYEIEEQTTHSLPFPPSEQDRSYEATPTPHTNREDKWLQRLSPQPTTPMSTIPEPIRHLLRQTTRQVSVEEQNRERMLQRLQRTYEELFAQSLQGVTRMELGLSDKPDAVQNAVTLLFQSSTRPERLLRPGTSILQVYKDAAYELLVLGTPGAGKSTLLVELARQLVVRANADKTHPLPVMLPLSSWAVKRLPLQIWLAEQVAQFYNIPKALAKHWIDEEQFLPLLDGLDEMEETARPACIAAINAYHRDHLRLPIVVCSRQAEYEEAARQQRLALQNAVVVQPLTHEQVQAYLAPMGESLSALRHVLMTNPALAEVTTTPLIVHVLILTYQGTSVGQLSTQNAQLQQQIWSDYLARMVERKGDAQRYPLHLTRAWLGWLASQVRTHNQTVFYLEHIQPDWLTDKQRRLYNWLGVRLPAILIGALVSVFIVWFFLPYTLEWSYLLRTVILGGLLGGLLCPIELSETMHSARKTLRQWGTALSISIGIGLLIGFSNRWVTDASPDIVEFFDGRIYGVLFGLSSLLLLLSAFSHRCLPTLRPSAGRWATLKGFAQQLHLRHSLLIGLLMGLSQGLSVGLSNGLGYTGENWLSYGLGDGLNDGLMYGLIYGQAGILISVILKRLQGGIHLTERVSFSWRNLRKCLFAPAHLCISLLLTGCTVVLVGLSFGLGVELDNWLDMGLIEALSVGLSNWLSSVLSFGLSKGLSVGLAYWLLLGLYQSLVQERIEDQDRRVPNQGIRQSLRNSLLLGLISGTLVGGVGILASVLNYGLSLLGYGLMTAGLIYGLGKGLGNFWLLFLVSSIFVWVITGGLAVWRHYLVRFLLQHVHTFPLYAARFLDDAAARILLRRLGGGYRFTHRLLLDSLADATDTDLRSKRES